MTSSRSFGPVAEQMKVALEKYSKDELIDLMTHIVKTYVVEGILPLQPETPQQSGEEQLAKLSFPQLILHLQMRLDHREWSAFSVSGTDVWVAAGGNRVNVTGGQSPLPPAPAPAPETRTQRGSSQAFGNPTEPPADEPDPSQAPEPDPERNPNFSDEEAEFSERFGMLEFD